MKKSQATTVEELVNAARKEDTDGLLSPKDCPQLFINNDISKWKDQQQFASEIAVFSYCVSAEGKKLVVSKIFGNRFEIREAEEWTPPDNFVELGAD